MTTPWKKSTAMQRSRRQEEKIGKLPGGKKQVNSGRHWFSKRDAQLTSFLIEARFTDAGSYRVEAKEFDEVTSHAFGTPPGQLPAMQIDFEREGQGPLQLWLMRLEDQVAQQQYILSLEEQLKQARRGA